MAKSWHPPAPSPEYPSMRVPGMRGRVQDHHREPTVATVVASARTLAVELDPGARELMVLLARLLEVEHHRAELAEAALRKGDQVSISPDCAYGKHQACDGVAWDDEADDTTECGCKCHG